MSSETSYADWIAVDWGTSNLRAWAMRGDTPVADAGSDRGMGTLEPSAFEGALLEIIEPWLGAGRMSVVACGMVGARQGWAEAAYATVPCRPVSLNVVRPAVADARLDVAILPGLCQTSPADVMRGEETQIAGYLAEVPDFDGVLCMPGTHTKWVQISASEVVSFRTYMTGELFRPDFGPVRACAIPWTTLGMRTRFKPRCAMAWRIRRPLRVGSFPSAPRVC